MDARLVLKVALGPVAKKCRSWCFRCCNCSTRAPSEVLHTDRACFIAHPSKKKVLYNVLHRTGLCELDRSLRRSEEPPVGWVKPCRGR